jgi:hypothetical protein
MSKELYRKLAGLARRNRAAINAAFIAGKHNNRRKS